MGYSFSQLYAGVGNVTDEIFNQEWVQLSQTNTMKEFSDTGVSSACSVENFINDVSHINTLIIKQGIFYKKTSGEPQPSGPENERIIVDVLSLCREILDKKSQYTPEVLAGQIVKYNDNMEKAMAGKYKECILEICDRYNNSNPGHYEYTGELLVNSTTGDCGYERVWVDDTITITDRNTQNLTLDQVRNDILIKKLTEKGVSLQVNIRSRDPGTSRVDRK